MPGEYWLDHATGSLYLWPPDGFSSAEVVVSLLEAPLVRLESASFVELRDLTLEAGRSELVSVEGGDARSARGPHAAQRGHRRGLHLWKRAAGALVQRVRHGQRRAFGLRWRSSLPHAGEERGGELPLPPAVPLGVDLPPRGASRRRRQRRAQQLDPRPAPLGHSLRRQRAPRSSSTTSTTSVSSRATRAPSTPVATGALGAT